MMQIPSPESLSHLLCPRSAAVVIEPDAFEAGIRIVDRMRRAGFPGRLFVILPEGKDLPGVPVFARLSDIAEPVELVVSSVRNGLQDLLLQCEQSRAGAVLLLDEGDADGLAATSGRHIAEVSAWSQRTGIPVCGPGSAGVAAETGLLGACVATANDWTLCREGTLGLAAAGGSAALAPLLNRLFSRQAPLRAIVSTGDEQGLTTLDAAEALLDDPFIKAIAMAPGEIHNGRAFVRLADKALELRKPIVVLRPDVAHAAVAGTASLFEAVCSQKSVYIAAEVGEWIAAAAFAGSGRELAGNRIAIMDLARGDSGRVAAELLEAGFRVSPLLELPLPGEEERVEWDGCVCVAGGDEADIERALQLLQTTNKPVCVLWLRDKENAELPSCGMPEFHDFDTLVRTMRHLLAFREKGAKNGFGYSRLRADRFALDRYGFGKFEDKRLEKASGSEDAGDTPGWDARELPRGEELLPVAGQPAGAGERMGNSTGAPKVGTVIRLSEVEGKRVLNAIGISTPRSRFFARNDDVQRMLQTIEFDGRPYVMKVVTREQIRKRDIGGVRLHVKDAQEVTRFFTKWVSSPERLPSAEGILVEEMVSDKLELRLNAAIEPLFGPVVSLALRDESKELPRYAARRIAPFDQAEAMRMVADVPGLSGQLNGTAESPPADRERLYELLAMFSRWVYELRDRLIAVEIDPLAVRSKGKGVCALDCAMSLLDK